MTANTVNLHFSHQMAGQFDLLFFQKIPAQSGSTCHCLHFVHHQLFASATRNIRVVSVNFSKGMILTITIAADAIPQYSQLTSEKDETTSVTDLSEEIETLFYSDIILIGGSTCKTDNKTEGFYRHNRITDVTCIIQ